MQTGLRGLPVWNCLSGMESLYGKKHLKVQKKALNEVLKIWLRDRDRLETGAVIFMTEKEAEAAGAYLKQKLETEAPEQRDTISYLDRNSGKFCKG